MVLLYCRKDGENAKKDTKENIWKVTGRTS